MIYFQAEHISKSFGDKMLFSGLSFSISQGDKIALIAPNGNGKTTLLQLIAGKEEPDSGFCSYKNDLRISYLLQEPELTQGNRVIDALLQSDNEQTMLLREYESFMQQGHHAEDPGKLQKLIERMDGLQAWDYEQRIKQVVSQLKIGDLNASVDQLSGGQQKRLALAGILLEDADMILLDEPTNHLDLDMIEWMEDYLGRKKTTMLVVTHDRYFLDAVCNGILEIDRGMLHHHRGNYSYYLEKKQERLGIQSAATDKAVNLLRKESEWMKRSPQARTTKSKARIDAYFGLQEKAATHRESGMEDIRMHMSRMGKKILELSDVTKDFGATRCIDQFSYTFKRGERIGIAGPNGSGKTTLLQVITGHLLPDKGLVTIGETIQFGYYRQEGLLVDGSKRVIEVITDIAESIVMDGKRTLSASQLLHLFNFNHSAQYDFVEKLSGGEKRRLYLLTVLMKNPNFLILDEPTNDFDIDTLNTLEAFLTGFNGCLLVVSHDRYFLDNLVDQLFIFEDNGKIRICTGNYSAYRMDMKSKRSLPSFPKQKSILSSSPKEKKIREKSKLSYRESQELEALEAEIESLEAEKDDLVQKMNSGDLSGAELQEASVRYAQLEAELEPKMERWLELSEWA